MRRAFQFLAQVNRGQYNFCWLSRAPSNLGHKEQRKKGEPAHDYGVRAPEGQEVESSKGPLRPSFNRAAALDPEKLSHCP
jgi:hypothetical protein